jgi:hypothetical protein
VAHFHWDTIDSQIKHAIVIEISRHQIVIKTILREKYRGLRLKGTISVAQHEHNVCRVVVETGKIQFAITVEITRGQHTSHTRRQGGTCREGAITVAYTVKPATMSSLPSPLKSPVMMGATIELGMIEIA